MADKNLLSDIRYLLSMSSLPINLHHHVAVFVDGAAIHAGGVERHGDVTVGVEGDDTAGAAGVTQGASNLEESGKVPPPPVSG